MTKAQKALCLALAVVLVISVFAFSALAADQTAEFTVSASETQIEVGDTITVTVAVTTDYYAAATGVPIYYDAEVFEYVADSLQVTEIFGDGAATNIQSNYAEPAGLLNVVIVPLDSYGAVSRHLSGTLLTFQLTAKAEGTSEIGLRAEDQKTESHIGGLLYCGAYASEDVTSAVTSTGQTFILSNTTVTVGTAAQPELAVKEGTTGVIDTVNKYVYGVTVGDVAENFFEATNNGSIRMVANDAGVENGTGAQLQLLDAQGGVLETYTLIIFGDVDGSGVVDIADSVTIMQYVADSAANALSDEQFMAADLDASDIVDVADSVTIMQYVSDSIVNALPVNPYIA